MLMVEITIFNPVGIYQIICRLLFFFAALLPNAGHGLLILEVSRPNTTTHHSW